MPRKDRSKGGRPPFDHAFMFKVLILETSHNLSDERTEYLIKDRLSFMRFLGLSLNEMVMGRQHDLDLSRGAEQSQDREQARHRGSVSALRSVSQGGRVEEHKSRHSNFYSESSCAFLGEKHEWNCCPAENRVRP